MNTPSPSRAVKLYGTGAPAPEPRVLRAGPLAVELVNGGLRYARYHGVEVLRGIDYVARDRNWGTYPAEIAGLRVEEGGGGFRVAYDGRCAGDGRELAYRAEITGEADGSLRFRVVATPATDFETNRTGFIVLHPLEGVAGRPVEVTHADGRTGRAEFPRPVSPGQPVFAIRALGHEAVPGVWATCTMAADEAFEMEDHRNWSDASFKTYFRPLGLPTPYVLRAGEPFEQSVSLTFRGRPAAPTRARGEEPVRIEVGGPSGGAMPRIGLGVPAEHAAAAVEVADLVAKLGPQLLVCRMDVRQGHGPDLLRRYRALSEATGAEVTLELVLPAEREPAAELAGAAEAVRASGLAPVAVVPLPAPYLKSIQPSGPWPDIPPLEAYYDAARSAFPGARVGGGMLTYFTELNRKRPPAGRIDFVTHTTCAVVHDADDRAVMEALEALPYIAETVRSFAGDTPYRVGPSMIGMRDNPYGAGPPAANRDNRRVAMAGNDPRQRGLFGAAWNAGYVAEMARAGVEAVALSAPVGEHGVVHRRMGYPQPYFDDLPDRRPAVYPLYHVLRAFAAAAGAPLLAATSSAPRRVACVAWRDENGRPALVLANLTDRALEVAPSGLPRTGLVMRRLDADTFAAATTDPDWWENAAGPAGPLRLDAYAVAAIEAAR